ncbi:Transposase IS4 [Popillia japonica]|uniref:Transposase IS4 n=1 Tax=Popillia japonica TaxID=7064 RepID=A0AAW1N479_POPJA
MGDSDSIFSGDITVYKWKDRGVKCVTVVSNMHEFEKKTEVLRTDKTGSRQKVPGPQAIADYNSCMGGVDHFDQLHATYTVTWKSRRWWMDIFLFVGCSNC